MLQDNKKSNPSCYITYEKYQWIEDDEVDMLTVDFKYETTKAAFKPSLPIKMEDNKQEICAFKPTWLVDTSDMSVVRGSDVCGPYYTLSYSWNQSGDYFKNEHDDGYTRIDRGLHKIVLDPVVRNRKGRPISRARVRHVKFEELIQEICQDFGARYIWWDQMCIDQWNKEEKRREIKQMHRIYENASRTIVLVPEFIYKRERDVNDTILQKSKAFYLVESQWFKRVWTLVEGFKSNKLLFVGRNVHMYSETFGKPCKRRSRDARPGSSSLISTICVGSEKWNACLALSHARKRATTKKHDYYFAFANMFPERLSSLKFSYAQDIQEVALEFYQRLAQNDPTILFFSAHNDEEKFERTMLGSGLENNRLPSWSGICGVHSEYTFGAGERNPSSFGLSDSDYIVSGSTIKVTCASISVSILDELDFPNGLLDFKYQAPDNYEWMWSHDVLRENGHHISRELYSSGNSDLTFFARPRYYEEESYYHRNALQLRKTHFLHCTMDGSYRYHNVPDESSKNYILGELSLTKFCKHCIILYGLRYTWIFKDIYYTLAPVITKDGDYYKSIGLCVFERKLTFPDIDTETKRTFVIR